MTYLAIISWATYIQDAKKDFEFLNSLPGRKILLKGNHDYWWTTLAKMKEFVRDNNFENIDFLYNNSYLVEDKIIVGTRGWAFNETDEKLNLNKICVIIHMLRLNAKKMYISII